MWRLATGLGAGMSRRQTVCGALAGGVLACGLIIGRERHSGPDDRVPLQEQTYAKVQALMRRFEERFGAIECRTMTGCDFGTPEGRQAFKDTQQIERTCKPAVRLVVETIPRLGLTE